MCKKSTDTPVDAAPVAHAGALHDSRARAAQNCGVARAAAARQAEQWLHDNQAALESSNVYAERDGLPLTR